MVTANSSNPASLEGASLALSSESFHVFWARRARSSRDHVLCDRFCFKWKSLQLCSNLQRLSFRFGNSNSIHSKARLLGLDGSSAVVKELSVGELHASAVGNLVAGRRGCSECVLCLASGFQMRVAKQKHWAMVHDELTRLASGKPYRGNFSPAATLIVALKLRFALCL